MNERKFSLDGYEFELSKLDVFKQFHIARRIAPLIAKMMPVMGQVSSFLSKAESSSELSEAQKFDQIAKLAEPLLEGFSSLPEEDADKLFKGLLACVSINQSGAWAPIIVSNTLAFANLELPTLFKCAGRAFMYNLGGFISALPQEASQGKSLKAKGR